MLHDQSPTKIHSISQCKSQAGSVTSESKSVTSPVTNAKMLTLGGS